MNRLFLLEKVGVSDSEGDRLNGQTFVGAQTEGTEGRTPLSDAHLTFMTHTVTPDSPEPKR